jgi:hypothetical protein
VNTALTSIETWLGVVRAEEAATSEVGPGLLAFTIVALLAVATFFLIRSMLHHMGKVPPTFDGQGEVPSSESFSAENSSADDSSPDSSEGDLLDPGLNER